MLLPSECYFATVILEDFLDRLSIIGEVIEAKSELTKKENIAEDDPDESSDDNGEKVMTEEELLFGKKKKLMTPEEKLSEDRKCLEEVFTSMFHELQCTKTCQTFTDAINDYKANKKSVEDLKERIHEYQEKQKNLQETVAKVQEDKRKYENDMEVIVYQLKDKLQKSKACLDLEVKYVFKRSETSTTQAAKLWSDKEKELKIQQQLLRSKKSYEDRISNEIKSFMVQSQKEYEDLLEMWKKKYDEDIAVKNKELTDLQNDKAVNLKKIQELSRHIQVYETFVENDRIEKQHEKEKEEKEQQEYNCIVKVQAWWRGTMVRKKLGPFAEKKVEKKAKKGGKKGKGKK